MAAPSKRDPSNMSESNDAKRVKPGAAASPLNPTLFTNAERTRLRTTFASNQPFTHVVIKDLCQKDTLASAREEIIHNIEAKLKETDLFKVYQTGDLANMDGLEPELAAKLPTLLSIRNALYSKDFRNFIENVVGLEENELTEAADCSCNVYAHGGHLLCHDDVISTRAVSYIVYLTDPDSEWQAEEGGALELYPLLKGDQGNPDVIPTTNLLPYFNSMALFTVQPGRSFHAVQEVYTDAKPRLSISGWYHRVNPPEGADQASLNQLKSKLGVTPFVPLGHEISEDDQYSPEEKLVLEKWINPTYLERKSVRSMVARWESDSCVQLHGFLKKDIGAKVLATIKELDEAAKLGCGRVPEYDAGMNGGWEAVGPVHKQRFLKYVKTQETSCPAGELLATVNSELFESSAFAKWLLRITDITIQAASTDIRRFRPGLDYTVAHLGSLIDKPVLDVTLCFVDDSEPDGQVPWSSDDLGGFQCYILADDEVNAAADTYKADGSGEDELISCSAAANTLNILLRDSSLMKFIKYVANDAPSSRFDIAAEFETDLSDEDCLDGDDDAK